MNDTTKRNNMLDRGGVGKSIEKNLLKNAPGGKTQTPPELLNYARKVERVQALGRSQGLLFGGACDKKQWDLLGKQTKKTSVDPPQEVGHLLGSVKEFRSGEIVVQEKGGSCRPKGSRAN